MIPSREEMEFALAQRHGEEIQKKFGGARVAICGLGGLGSNVAVALARAGVGYLHLIDFDRVDISNLNRQQYFADQIGMNKTEALTENIKRIAPYVELRTDTVMITEENVRGILKDDDIICEAFDKAENKAMLVNAVMETFPEKPVVAASGMAGIGSANSIVTKRITRNFYLCGDRESDVASGLGLFSARVIACAAHEAQMILRIIAGERDA